MARALQILPADSDEALDRAARALCAGRLVAFPTETVYGLGADATDRAALGRIFAAKGRPTDHPLIVHLAGAEDMGRCAIDPSRDAFRLAEAFWPGPLTIVVARAAVISPAASGGRASIGLRVPDHPAALELLRRTARPVAAPSANRFGRVSPTTAADVCAEFAESDGAIDLVLDGGACRVGVESTIVELIDDDPLLLRSGGVPLEAIEAVLGRTVRLAHGPSRAPGMMVSHYAPNVAVEVVDAAELFAIVSAHHAAGRRIAVLGGSPDELEALPFGVLRLGSVGDTEGYARLLYRRLREADEAGVDRLVAVLPPPEGLGRAVADRLRKAAAPRF